MRTKSLVLLLLALGCGLIASIGISQVIERNRNASGPAIEYEDIVVAADNLKEGEKLKAASVELKPFPKGTAPEGAYHSIEETLKVTHKLRSVIAKGEAILPNKFLDPNQDNTTRIPKGMRVVAIQADSTSAAGNLLKPDDRVDLLLHVPAGQNQPAVVKTVLKNIRVFSVNDNTRAVSQEGEATQEKNTRFVTLLVTTEQQGVVMLAQHQGQLKLSLRHPDDTDDDKDDLKSMGKVLSQNGSSTTNNAEEEERKLKPMDRVSNSVGNFFDTLNEVAAKAKDQQPTPVAPASAGAPPASPYDTFNMVIIDGSTPRAVDMLRDKKNPKGNWVSGDLKGARFTRPSAPTPAPVSTATSTTIDSLGLPTQPADSSVKNTTF